MLTLTPTAAEALQQLVANTAVNDETGGLRISSGEPTAQGAALELSLVDAPEPADDALDADGAHVFLEPGVAPYLDDKVLDASIESGQVRFAVFDRRPEDNGGPPA